MAERKSGVRKGRIIVDTGQAGVKAYADVDLGDFEGLTREVSKWTSAAKSSTDLGTVKGSNLLDAVQKHGVAQRERGKSPIGLEFSGKKILDELDKFKKFDTGSKVSLVGLQEFTVLKEWMEQVDEGSGRFGRFNPRNIPFQGIRDVDDNGRGIDPYDLFGHYRTPVFEDKMEIVNPGGDYSSVNKEWYSESMNTAKPPLWQAMYGDGSVSDSFQGTKSLIQVVRKADEVYDLIRKNLKIGAGTDPVVLTGKGTGVTAYEIDEFKKYADRVAANMDRNPTNSKYITKNGHLKWRMVQKEIGQMLVRFDTQKEKAFAKKALKQINLNLPEGMEVTEGYVTFGPKQINQLIYKAGDERGSYVRLKNQNKLLEVIQPEREPDRAQKSSGSLEMSWMDVLKR